MNEYQSSLLCIYAFFDTYSLYGPGEVKLSLHNAYRDVHFWKLSDGADFEKEARAAEMRSRPHYEAGP